MQNLKKTLIYSGISLAALVVLTSGYFLLKSSFTGALPPNTMVAGINLSLKTPEEALQILEKEVEGFYQKEYVVVIDEKKQKLTPPELGVNVLTEETIEIIEALNGVEMGVLDTITIPFKKAQDLDLLIEIDGEKLDKNIQELFGLKETLPKPATFYFDDRYLLQISEEEVGYVYNEDELLKNVKESARTLLTREISLKTEKEEPVVTKEVLEKQQHLIQEKLNHQLELIDPIYSDNWYVKLIDHLDWVYFEQKAEIGIESFSRDIIEGDSSSKEETWVSIKVKQEKLDEFVDEEISKWLDRPAEDVKIFKDDDEQVVIEGKGRNGLEIQRDHLKKAVELAVENMISEVPISVLEIEPNITISKELQELGIKERIGLGHTSYYGSPANRLHNIEMGASKFNGKLLAPEEIFSFNDILGPVDGANGYRKELVIKKEGTIPEYGGGICQVSTTVYRAALLTGLPIVERNQHSYAVSYYSQIMGHGLDATIYLGGANLKFQNDTDHHILIQTYTENDYELYVVVYGTDPVRTIEMEGPYISGYKNPGPTIYEDTTTLEPGQTKQQEKAHTGFYAEWYRHITDAEGNVTTEKIETNYKAIPAKILVGVGAE
ncbi:hypothetical protein HN709_02670 [Candidatus Peregrinibacteria bacterium]|jgi:vancomycin resistance protein YoaR|nr:hypothetical protein [Candidatus Peregrinibacteria bacterium]